MNSSTNILSRYIAMLVFGAAILLSGLAFVAVRASADTAPVISAVVATPSNTGATVTWTTDQAGTTQVQYGLTSAYNASTTLDNTSVNSHTAFLGGLTPNTLYHFDVLTGNATGTVATSSDMTFTTTNTASSTAAAPVTSNVVATPTGDGAVITWNTDQSANSQILYGLSSVYSNSTGLDTSDVTSHSETITGLMPNTMYHFQVWSTGTASSTAGTSADMTFTTLMASTTTTGTGTTTEDMEITTLQGQVITLQAELAALQAQVNAWTMGAGSGSTTPPTGGATIDQDNNFLTAGGLMDLSGRNFGHEETVLVTLNGNTVATAHADGGGNFSTGSFVAPSTPGTYTFVFTGQTSGDTASTNVTIH